MVYYNENCNKAAAWLRELIAEKLIPDGKIDTRSIVEVSPSDLDGFTQCHFFAGVGGWSRAIHLAGWPTDRPVWTGSCPCQPFSVAGQGKGVEDDRHLWPEFQRLIEACKPATVFGEQVASAAGREWLAGVFADLEAMGYSRAGADLCAAGIGAPHIRQRLYWVADAAGKQAFPANSRRLHSEPGGGSFAGRLVLPDSAGREPGLTASAPSRHGNTVVATGGADRLVQPVSPRLEGLARNGDHGNEPGRIDANPVGSTPASGSWSDFYIIPFADGKSRRVESGSFPLVDGLPKGVVHCSDPSLPINPQATAEGRVMRLKGYGNAIVPQLAAEFIKAFLET